MSNYVHALKYKFLTPFYDSVISATMREKKFRELFVQSLNLKPGQRVLDVGSGTGSLLVLIKKKFPEVDVVGIDGDEDVLSIAKDKARASGLDIKFKKAIAEALPFEDKSFDVVVSSLVFHHLKKKQKLSALKEIHRVLKDKQPVHIFDWSTPSNKIMRILFYTIQLLDGFETTSDSIDGSLMVYLSVCNFEDVDFHGQFNTVFGTLAVHSAVKGERVQDLADSNGDEEFFTNSKEAK